jgi:hypothetical protein
VGKSTAGAVAAEAPPASDNKPAAPSTGMPFAARLRLEACFEFDIVKIPSLDRMLASISILNFVSAPSKRALESRNPFLKMGYGVPSGCLCITEISEAI